MSIPVFTCQKKFYSIARAWSMILSRLKILHADKRIFYVLLTSLMVPVTQSAWRQGDEQKDIVTAKLVSEFLKILIENSTVKWEDA